MWGKRRRLDLPWRKSVAYMSQRLRGGQEGENLKQVWKAPGRNIYTYIGRCLIGAVDGGAVARIRTFPDTNFYDNAYALKCKIRVSRYPSSA